MDRFFDEAARILASKMPRRRALGRLGALIGGSLMASLGASSAQAQTTICKVGSTTITCGSGKVCCTTSSKPFCVSSGKKIGRAHV